MDTETLIVTGQSRLAASYGPGADTLPPGFLQAILAFVMSMISNCPAPTPASIKAEAATPVFGLRMLRKIHAEGVFGAKASKSLAAVRAVISEASDADTTALIKAAADTE